jgi:hypothetical protein
VANTRTAAQLGHGSALKAALATESDATLLMPATSENELLVVSVRRPAARAVAPAAPVRERVAVNAPEPPRVVSEPPKRPQQHTVANPAANDMEPVAYEATGFLGLEDSPLYASDLEPKPKKKWWKKLLDND